MDSLKQESLQREKEFHNELFQNESQKRAPTFKYYRLKKEFDEKYLNTICKLGKNKKILEIGCGPTINTPNWIDIAAESWAIDISEVAIEQSIQKLGDKANQANLKVMNAEELDFEEETFDVICGKGIIHHLDVEKAYSEFSRVLKPGGIAIFIEPLGHNPFINLYRKLTPQMRSEDEHPLLINDIHLANHYFKHVQVDYRHITSIISAYIPAGTIHTLFFKTLSGFDKLLMTVLPFMKRNAWMVLMTMKKEEAA